MPPSSDRAGAIRFAALPLLLALACRPPAPPPVLSTLPEFSLLDSTGARVTNATLAGRPFLADFIFTRCPAACPRLTARLKKLAEELPESSRVRLVSFSVDPVHDRPEVLQGFANRWGIRDPRWIFLTGEREAIWKLIRSGFLLPIEDQADPSVPFLHSNRFALVDGSGQLRGTYEAFEDEAIERLLFDLGAVEKEAAR